MIMDEELKMLVAETPEEEAIINSHKRAEDSVVNTKLALELEEVVLAHLAAKKAALENP